MHSQWLSLLWKEWREYQWKVAALTLAAIFYACFLVVSFAEGEQPRFDFAVCMAVLFIYSFLGSVFLGMGVAARENSKGTLLFLKSLPVEAWKAAVAKILIVSVVAVLPILVFLGITFLCYRLEYFSITEFYFFNRFLPPDMDPDVFVTEYYKRLAAMTIVTTLSLLWWTAALGVNRSDEIRAGAVAFLGIVVICIVFGFLFHLIDNYHWHSMEPTLRALASGGPGGPLWRIDEQANDSLNLPLPDLDKSLSPFLLISHAAVIVLFVLRFGRSIHKTNPGESLLSSNVLGGALKSPFKSQLSAIAWKQMRDTGPLAALTLTAAFAIAGFVWWANSTNSLSNSTFLEAYLGTLSSMSIFVVMVSGVGIFLDDLKSGLSDFWRSRPVNLPLWFGVKYLTGILIQVVFLGIPALCMFAILSDDISTPFDGRGWLGVLYILWIFVMLYSLTLMFYCLVRQPIYAVVLTIFTIWLGAYGSSEIFASPPYSWAIYVPLAILVWGVVLSLAWMAIRHDWGWKQ